MPTESQDESNIFELVPGKYIDIQFSYPVDMRLKIQLIGYDLGNYIILKHPDTALNDNYKDVLVEGHVVVARYIIEGGKGQCFAFRSVIRHVTKHPEKLLILDYPENIEKRELRMEQRHITHMPASINLTSEKNTLDNGDSPIEVINGVIKDISLKGCGFVFKSKNKDIKVKQRKINIIIQTPNNGEVTLLGYVRNSRFEFGNVNVGVQFNDEDQQVKNLLELLFINVCA